MSEAIEAFWAWFSSNADLLADATMSDSTIAALEARLFAIDDVGWEIGPGLDAPHMFALSPGGIAERLAVTRRIIERAPQLPGWEFHPAKPKKRWDLAFEIVSDGETVPVDGKRWELVLYRFKDGAIEIVLRPDPALRISWDLLDHAAMVIVDGELGEEVRMTLVNKIVVVSSWDEQKTQRVRKLTPGLLEKSVARRME